MLLRVSTGERRAILRAMAMVASGDRRGALSPADELAIASANRIVFGADEPTEPRSLVPITPAELSAALERDETAAIAGRVLAIMALVDGVLDADRLSAALRFAAALGLREQYLVDLAEAARGHLAWVGADLTRQNVLSITGGQTADLPLLPYRDAPDAALVERYRALSRYPRGTLGREFLEWYADHRYPIPGEALSLNERFVRPHDSTHLISGYSTTPDGEILVSTFTSGMMGMDQPLGAHILPALLSLHVGVRINDVAGAWHCNLDPAALWRAWDRGAACRTNIFAAEWDFWRLAAVPLGELRQSYAVPPL